MLLWITHSTYALFSLIIQKYSIKFFFTVTSQTLIKYHPPPSPLTYHHGEWRKICRLHGKNAFSLLIASFQLCPHNMKHFAPVLHLIRALSITRYWRKDFGYSLISTASVIGMKTIKIVAHAGIYQNYTKLLTPLYIWGNSLWIKSGI